MQYLYLLLLVAMCQGLAVQKLEEDPLPRPNLLSLTALDPPTLQVEWGQVKNVAGSDPVMGYKLLIWELPPVKTYKYKVVDGVWTLVEKLTPPKIGDSESPPEKDAMEILVPDLRITKVRVPKIKLNAIYEVRVRAFSDTKDGPLSSHMRVQLLDEEPKYSEKEKYNDV